MRWVVVTILLLASTACRHVFPAAYSVEQLRTDTPTYAGEALVHYLAQRRADPGVCDLQRENVLSVQDERLIEPFVAALERGEVELSDWKDCARLLVRTMTQPHREHLLARLARAVTWLLPEDDASGRLAMVHDALIKRPREASPALTALLYRLRERRRDDLDLDAARILGSLVTTLELGDGQLDGRPVTPDVIDDTHDEALLYRMSRRLPDAALRELSRTRVVRLRIARSPWEEVREQAAEVEQRVLTAGRWAQATSGLTLQQTPAPRELPFEVLVQQDVPKQQGRLVVAGATRGGTLPELRLRGVVSFDVGWSRPLDICAPPDELDVSPCIEARDLEVAVPEVSLDEDGVLVLAPSMSMERVVELARRDEGLVLPLRLAGQPAATLTVPLAFDEPPSMLFVGPPGTAGPALRVTAEVLPSSVIFDATSIDGVRGRVVWPRTATRDFVVASVGGAGVNGVAGERGVEGAAGVAGGGAICPTMPGRSGTMGDQGGPGGDGTDGGDGGDGGPVTVSVRCDDTVLDCAAARELLGVLVQSRGGAAGVGGAAGPGGRGGPGGAGGAGASCSVNGTLQFLANGFNGARGPNGPDGKAGADGKPGDEGTVKVE